MADDKNDSPNSEKPKIIVDDDWKAQAKAEKEKLAEETKAGKAAPQAPRELPPASFETLVSSIGTQAMFVLGMVPDPRDGQRFVDLDLAKHHIDSLVVLDAKTKGNLEDAETKLLDQTLHELRMQFVRLSQAGISRGVLGTPPGAAPSGEPPAGPAPASDAGEPQA